MTNTKEGVSIWSPEAARMTVSISPDDYIVGYRIIPVRERGDFLHKGQNWEVGRPEFLEGIFTHLGFADVDEDRVIVLRRGLCS